MSTEVDETLERLKNKKGVLGVIIMDWEGRAVRTTFNQEETDRYADVLYPYAQKSRDAAREIDATDDLTFVRLRSTKHEITIAPDKDYLMVVVQQPTN